MPNFSNLPAALSPEILRILIADDDDSLRDILQNTLQNSQRVIQVYKDGQEAIQALQQSSFDLVITDLKMSGADGLQVLEEAKRCHPESIVIIMTGYASLDTAIRAIRGGAYDYIRKPFKIDELEIAVHNACEKIFLLRENQRLLQKLQETMIEMKNLRQSWDENLARLSGPSLPSPESSLSEMDVTLKQIPPDYDLRKKEVREKAIHDLEKLIRLRREGSIDENEFFLFKKMLVRKLSD
jgi:DNA-binding response OmpR family regulator